MRLKRSTTFLAGLLFATMFVASCNTDTIGPIPNGVDESVATVTEPEADTATKAVSSTAMSDDEIADPGAAGATMESHVVAAGLDASQAPADLAFVDGGDTEYPMLDDSVAPARPAVADRPMGNGATLVGPDGILLVTCGTEGIDVESDGRPITTVAVSSLSDISTFLTTDMSTVSISGSIQTIWVDVDGVERRFDC